MFAGHSTKVVYMHSVSKGACKFNNEMRDTNSPLETARDGRMLVTIVQLLDVRLKNRS